MNDLWRSFWATPRPLRKLIGAALVVAVLMSFRYWRVMLAWESFVLLVVVFLHFSQRRSGGS